MSPVIELCRNYLCGFKIAGSSGILKPLIRYFDTTLMRARARNKKGGFTLLELIITLAIIMIVSSGVFVAHRQSERRALENASLQLQADIRYAQRRAVIDGQQVNLLFDFRANMYRILLVSCGTEVRRVYFQNGVRIRFTTDMTTTKTFHPRGTIGNPLTMRLVTSRYYQELTTTISGGRVAIRDIGILQQRTP